jgi:paraquat-inducible protein A
MKPRNLVAFLLVLLSYGLLVPGLTWPLLTIRASVSFMGRTIDLFEQTRSILQSIRELHETGNDFVAGLVLLFGVVVPVVKGALLAFAALSRNAAWRYRAFAFVRSISKWAMADVFAMGIFVAYLAGKAAENLDAQIRVGFYYFVAYCVVSLLALQVMSVPRPPQGDGNPRSHQD